MLVCYIINFIIPKKGISLIRKNIIRWDGFVACKKDLSFRL